jgi:phage portal protein BeeE
VIEMLIQRTQPTIITKVRAHTNIAGNEYTDKLAKDGNKLPDKSPIHPYERAHPTPYYFHKDNWPSMDQTPNKGPIHHLQPYLQKYEKEHSFKTLLENFPTSIYGPVIQI